MPNDGLVLAFELDESDMAILMFVLIRQRLQPQILGDAEARLRFI